MKSINTLIPALCLAALLFAGDVFAQKISVKLSHVEKPKGKSPGIFKQYKEIKYTEDDEAIYSRVIVDNDDKTISVGKVRKSDGQTLWVKLLPLPKKATFEDLYKVKNGFIMFFIQDKNIQMLNLTNDLVADGAPSVVSPSLPDYKYSTKLSEDKILLSAYPKEETSGSYKFSLFDLNLKMFYEKEINLSRYKYVDLYGTNIEDDGSLIMAFKVSTNGKDFFSSTVAIDYIAYHYDAKTKNMQSQTIKWGEGFAQYSSLRTKLDDDNIFCIYGLYKTTKGEGSEGIFIQQFDIDAMEETQNELIPFTKPILENYLDPKLVAKGKFPTTLVLQNKLDHTNGTITFVIEEDYSMQVSSNNGSYTVSHRNNIVLVNTNETGNINWTHFVPKTSSTRGVAGYICTYSFLYNDKIYLLFNSDKESALNPEKSNGYGVFAMKDVMMVMLGINKNGVQTVKKVFNQPEEEDEKCNIYDIEKIKPNTLLLTFEERSLFFKLQNSSTAIVEIED